jgi:hypothetical protein
MTGTRYRVNRPSVIDQTIEGEVIMINLETGTYYSLIKSAAEIWSLVESSVSLDAIVNDLAARYEVPSERVQPTVLQFLGELEREKLIVQANGQIEPNGQIDGRPSRIEGPARSPAAEPFEPPVLEKFEDMQDLILLDPVHEVDENRGWPERRPQGP